VIKVLLVIPTLDRSGAEKQLTLLATRLPRDEFQVHVVALTRGGPFADVLNEHEIPLTVLNKRWKFDPRTLWQLKKLIGEFQPDILHTWLFAANSYGRLIAGKKPTPKVLVSERCVDTWKSGWQNWLDRRQVSRTTRLIGNSQSVVDFYKTLGYSSDNTIVIRNGIDVRDPEPIDREKVLAEFGISSDARIVGFVGRLARQKRIDDLIWATELLHHSESRSHCLIVGDGPQRETLERFAHNIGRSNEVTFTGHRNDAARLMQTFDAFWLASDFEGQSNSLMEAMALGLPVVASDIAPNRELVTDGESGVLVKVGDRVAYAQAAGSILADSQLAQNLGDAARRRMQTDFPIEMMVDSHATLYREVVS